MCHTAASCLSRLSTCSHCTAHLGYRPTGFTLYIFHTAAHFRTCPHTPQEYDKAIETYQEGLKHDPENHELKEGLMRCVQAINKVGTCCCWLGWQGQAGGR